MPGALAGEAPTRGRVVAAQARRALRAHRITADESIWLVALAALTFVILVFSVRYAGFPLSAFLIPLVAGSLLLERRAFLALTLVVSGALLATLGVGGATANRVAIASVVAIIAAILLVASYRSLLGAGDRLGESMLVDLRDRLQTQSQLPPLPDQWECQAQMLSAGGARFAGDFIVAARTDDLLEVVMVDVSGKGMAAGSRALQLSGAFGGLLGALPAEQFLPAANRYLLRQEWSEGFATAAHLALSLSTGSFLLWTAGHPPGVQWHAGSGRWEVHESVGPALGLLPDAEFVPIAGVIDPDDAFLLFTDGLVETRDRDYTLGIDKMLGEGERLQMQGWDRSTERLLERLDATGDDRAILLLHRR